MPLNTPPKSDAVKAPWYVQGLEFACEGCGGCCTGGPGYVWLSDQEIGRLAEFLKISVKETLSQYCRKIGNRYSLREIQTPGDMYDCVFLTDTCPTPASAANPPIGGRRRGCSIYPVRPLQCRTWPFWEGNLASPSAWQRAGKKCPGINRGRRHDRQGIEKLRDARDWPEGC